MWFRTWGNYFQWCQSMQFQLKPSQNLKRDSSDSSHFRAWCMKLEDEFALFLLTIRNRKITRHVSLVLGTSGCWNLWSAKIRALPRDNDGIFRGKSIKAFMPSEFDVRNAEKLWNALKYIFFTQFCWVAPNGTKNTAARHNWRVFTLTYERCSIVFL